MGIDIFNFNAETANVSMFDRYRIAPVSKKANESHDVWHAYSCLKTSRDKKVDELTGKRVSSLSAPTRKMLVKNVSELSTAMRAITDSNHTFV